jgi:TPR repeat protein
MRLSGSYTCLFLTLAAACSNRHQETVNGPSADAGWIRLKNLVEPCTDLPVCEAACQKGSAQDCLRAAYAYSAGAIANRNDTRATELFEKACALGNGAGCTFVGRMYEFAHGVPKDEARAVAAYQRACDLEYVAGCYNLAIMLENGRGAEKDVHRAMSFYQRACAAGVFEACEAAQRLAHLPDGGA